MTRTEIFTDFLLRLMANIHQHSLAINTDRQTSGKIDCRGLHYLSSQTNSTVSQATTSRRIQRTLVFTHFAFWLKSDHHPNLSTRMKFLIFAVLGKGWYFGPFYNCIFDINTQDRHTKRHNKHNVGNRAGNRDRSQAGVRSQSSVLWA